MDFGAAELLARAESTIQERMILARERHGREEFWTTSLRGTLSCMPPLSTLVDPGGRFLLSYHTDLYAASLVSLMIGCSTCALYDNTKQGVAVCNNVMPALVRQFLDEEHPGFWKEERERGNNSCLDPGHTLFRICNLVTRLRGQKLMLGSMPMHPVFETELQEMLNAADEDGRSKISLGGIQLDNFFGRLLDVGCSMKEDVRKGELPTLLWQAKSLERFFMER